MKFVYIVQDPQGALKIGVATDPAKRLSGLQIGTPHILRLVHIESIPDEMSAFAVEQKTHATLNASHVRGEWFAVSVETARAAIADTIFAIKNGMFLKQCVSIRGRKIVQSTHKFQAARELLNMSQTRLAELSHVHVTTVRNIESGRTRKKCITYISIERALIESGIEFRDAGVVFSERHGVSPRDE